VDKRLNKARSGVCFVKIKRAVNVKQNVKAHRELLRKL
jgi:hypothetical protein